MSNTNAYKANRSLTTVGTTPQTGIVEAMFGGHRGGGVQISGTFVGTVQFEESLDGGSTWIAKTVFPFGGGIGVTSATAAGRWKFAAGGSTHFRVRCSAFTSGAIVVDLALTKGVDLVGMTGGASGSGDPVSGATLVDAALALTGASQVLVAADPTRLAVIVSNADSNEGVGYSLTNRALASVDLGINIPPGGQATIVGKAAQNAMTVIGTAGQNIVVVEGH